MKTLRVVIFMLAGFTLLTVWNSCKKGPDDPFFSIYSRLSRICGEWKITEFKVNYVDSIRRVIDSIPNGVGSCGPESDKNIDTYNYTWKFEKSGIFTEKLILFHDTINDIINNTLLCPDFLKHDSTITTKVEAWNFTSGVGDFKNKEQMYIFDPEKGNTIIYSIIELRSKEMKLETQTIQPDTNIVHLKQYTMTKL